MTSARRPLLTAALCGVLAVSGCGGTDDEQSGPDLWLGTESSGEPDEGLSTFLMLRDLDVVQVSRADTAPCVTGEDAAGAEVEITAVTTEKTRGEISITGFGIYDVPLEDLTPAFSEVTGPLSHITDLGPARSSVDRLCSEEETQDTAVRTDLFIEFTRHSPRVDRVDLIEHATVHYTVDGEKRSKPLGFAVGFCTFPEDVARDSPDARDHCVLDRD